MIDASSIRAGLLLGPMLVLAVLWIGTRPGPLVMTAAMLAFLWNVPFILLVNVLAFRLGWWSFAPSERSLLPVEILLGWAIFWGPIPTLACAQVNFLVVVLAFAWIDLVFMPQL